MGTAALVVALLVGVRVVFRLLAAGWARPWAARYLEATARPKQKARYRSDDGLRVEPLEPLSYNEFIRYLQARGLMGLGEEDMVIENDPFGANQESNPYANNPRWNCRVERQSPGQKTCVSYAATPEEARREAAAILQVPASEIIVVPYVQPEGGSDQWINPQDK